MNVQDIQTPFQSNNNDGFSREGVVECTYNLLQTDKELIPDEEMDLHLVCPEQEVAVVSTSTNLGVHNLLSPDNVAAEDQSENCCPHETNGTMQSELLLIVEDILPDGGEEPVKEVSPFVPQQQQQSPSPPTHKEDPSDTVVLRKFLRRSRYFDSGNSCLEDRVANRLAQKSRKICYLCGKLRHDAKKCPKRRACYNCKSKGHFAVDCPLNIEENDRMCLRCGEIGHEISSCNNDYCPDDLEKIHCYVCNELGHIICGSSTDISALTLSCYNCGESGHSGLQCPKPLLDRCGSKPPSICYKCGEEGHVARNCSIPYGFTGHCGQDGASQLGPETNDPDAQQENKRARRSKSFRHGRARRRKMKGMAVDCMTV